MKTYAANYKSIHKMMHFKHIIQKMNTVSFRSLQLCERKKINKRTKLKKNKFKKKTERIRLPLLKVLTKNKGPKRLCK